jgi:hypothetical protein
MASKSSNNSNSGLSLQEQLFTAIKVVFPDAEAKKINKDNFLDIYIPSVSPARGTHLFFNTVKGAIKVGFYIRDEVFINNVVSVAYQSIDVASNGLRIIGNPKFVDVESAVAATLDFLSAILNENVKIPLNTNEQVIERGAEIEKINEELINSFVEKKGHDYLCEFLENYLVDGEIVIITIDQAELIIAANDEAELSELVSTTGSVDFNSWSELSKFIGKKEANWVKKEFKSEDPSGIVLFYCNGNYVYSFSKSKEEGFLEDSIEESESLNIDRITIPQILNEINADKKLKHIQITYYINDYSDLNFGLVYKVNNCKVEVNRVNWFNDSYWTGEIERDDLIEGMTKYLEGQISGLELFEDYMHADDWKFDRAGILDNGVEFSITDLNGLENIPKNLQDEEGELDVWELSNYLVPVEEDLYDENKGRTFSYEFSLNGKTYGLVIDRSNEREAEVDNDVLMAVRWMEETPARITLLFDSLLALLSQFHTRGSNEDEIQYFMVEFENIVSSEIILSNNKILDKVRNKLIKEWDKKDEEEWVDRYCSAYEILVSDFNLESEINKSLITLSSMPEEDSGELNFSVLDNLDIPYSNIFSDTDIDAEVSTTNKSNQIGLYTYDILECSVQELRKEIEQRNLSNRDIVELIAYNNTLTEFDEDYTLVVEGQEVWLTISRSYNDSYWKTQIDNNELLSLFNNIQKTGFKSGFDNLTDWEFYAPGKGENSFEIRLKECDEDILPENCFIDGEVDPYSIFDNYESNLEDIDITIRGETQLLDIIVNEEYIGSIWSGAYPSR